MAFVLVLGAAACGGSNKPMLDQSMRTGSGSGSGSATAESTTEVPAELATKVEHVFTFLDELVTAAEGAMPDCTKMAAAMDAVVDGPDGTAVKDLVLYPNYQKYEHALDEKYGKQHEEMDARLGKMSQTCFPRDGSPPPDGAEAMWKVFVKAGLASDEGGGAGDADGDTDEGPSGYDD